MADKRKGQMLKNALLDLGIATLATQVLPFGADVLWGLLADTYLVAGVQSAKQAAENLMSDLEDRGGGKYALTNMKLITDAGTMFYELDDGTYVTDWMPAGTVLRFRTLKNREIVTNTVGIVGFGDDIRITQDRITGVTHQVKDLVNGATHTETIGYTSAWTIKNAVMNVNEYRMILSPAGRLKFEVDCYTSLEWSFYVTPPEWNFQEHQIITKYGDYYIGTLFEYDTEDIIFNTSAAPGSAAPYHIGQDVSHVDSLTGGNGADAGLPRSAPEIIGHGGNGGHGGGGGGAPGYCKQETISAAGDVSIDFAAKVGTMTPGTGGLGTEGTPGYHGGCIIYWDEGGGLNA